MVIIAITIPSIFRIIKGRDKMLHVVCSHVGYKGFGDKIPDILNGVIWSETPVDGTPTTQQAPEIATNGGAPIFYIVSTVNAWVAIGSIPDETSNPRIFVLANEPLPIFVETGDKLAWTVVS